MPEPLDAPTVHAIATLRNACAAVQAALAADQATLDDTVLDQTSALAHGAAVMVQLIAQRSRLARANGRASKRNHREHGLLLRALRRLTHPASDDSDLDHALRVLAVLRRRGA